jgi:hypothetical protein
MHCHNAWLGGLTSQHCIPPNSSATSKAAHADKGTARASVYKFDQLVCVMPGDVEGGNGFETDLRK